MTKTTRFRFWGIVSVLTIMAVICWQILPETSAQKNDKSLPDNASNSPANEKLPDNFDAVLLNAGHINVKSSDVQADRHSIDGFSGKRLHLVRFKGPIEGKWVDMLTGSGVEIVNYIPHYTYLVYGDAPSIQRIQAESRNALSPIEWEGEYKDSYRVMPSVYFDVKADNGQTGLRSNEFSIQLVKDADANAETFALVKELQTAPVKGQQEILRYVNFVVALDEKGLEAMMSRPDVISIYPYITPRKFDERLNLILRGNLTGPLPTAGDYLTYLADKGFTQGQFAASNFAVDVTDSGVDTATPASPNQWLLRTQGDPAGSSRFIYSRLEGTPHAGSTLQGCDGHGNLNATIVAGYVPSGGIFGAFPHADANGFRYGLGVAPFVKVGSSVIFDPDVFTSPNFANLQSRAYDDGARISTNSWGAAVGGAYTADAQAYDALVRDAKPASAVNPLAGNQEMVIIFSAGNQGSGANTIGAPGTGKNVFTVGASENVQAFGGADGCGVGDTGADSAMDIISFSSRGPNDDGRVKPDIMLPGTHVSGGAAQNVLSNPVAGNGTQLACFTAEGVCGGVGPAFDFFPLGQQWYTASSGTSHSTPAIAGLAALIRQHFINQTLTPPSPAMTKAIVMNSAEYMTGVGANDNLPSNNQGMGLADLDRYFDIFAQSRFVRDQDAADTFTDTGQQRFYIGNVVDNTKPLRVTVAWTDAPGSTTGNAFVNNLDLEVTVGANTYKGNVFTGANSTTGGAADTRNNVESVFIPAGVTGTVSVKVKAANIAGDGLPNNADATDQDFALVVSNIAPASVAILSAGTPVITSGNNTLEPNECNLVNIPLTNNGNIAATSVSATLSTTTPGVSVTVPTSPYADIPPEGGTQINSIPFQVSTDNTVACFTAVNLNLSVTYTGGSSPVNFSLPLSIGSPPNPNYTFASTTGNTLAPGGTLVAGTQTDDAVVNITAPFAFSVYGTAVANGATLRVTTNGNMQITGATGSSREANGALPNAGSTGFGTGAFDAATPVLMPYWDDLIMTSARLGATGGIFQQTTGVAPNRQWIVEWRAQHFNGNVAESGISTNFAIIFNEGSENFSYIYGATGQGTHTGGATATIGVQAATTGTQFTQFSLDTNSVSVGQGLNAARAPGACNPGSGSCTAGPVRTVRADFDADGTTDLSVFRPSDRVWWVNQSSDGLAAAQWGIPGDEPLGGDFSGDRGSDLTVYRPQAPIELPDFHIVKTDTNTYETVNWGLPGDIPLIGDYNNDGVDDIAVYRPSETVFYIWFHNDVLPYRAFQFGQAGDIPIVGNFIGDASADAVLYRPSTGTWFIVEATGDTSNFTAIQFGSAEDKPVPADYDGDGKDDIALYRPSEGNWYIVLSATQELTITRWGISTDTPVPGDYDGDGEYDIAIFRQGQWWVIGSTAGPSLSQFGVAGDIPIPATYIP
jgi:hypothetical protein